MSIPKTTQWISTTLTAILATTQQTLNHLVGGPVVEPLLSFVDDNNEAVNDAWFEELLVDPSQPIYELSGLSAIRP